MPDAPADLILVVEDEPLVRWIALEALQQEGYEVVEAENADQALAILRDRRGIGVLFTDVNMPGPLDGIALAELVHEHWPQIRLVVTSGQGVRPPGHGAFLSKPYSLSALAATIRAACEP